MAMRLLLYPKLHQTAPGFIVGFMTGRQAVDGGDRAMSDWQVDVIKQGGLPKLAWLAEVSTDAGVVVVHHGGAVETRPHWVVGGTWEGRFEAGDFHRAETLLRSGMRVHGSAL